MHLLRRCSMAGLAERLFVALELPEEARGALAAFRDAPGPSGVAARCPTRRCTSRWRSSGTRRRTTSRGGRGRGSGARPRAARSRSAPPLLLPPRRARVLSWTCATRPARSGSSRPARRPGWRPRASTRPSAAVPAARDRRAPARGARRTARAPPGSAAPLAFHGGAVTLYRSRLHPHGARYEPLARVRARARVVQLGLPGYSRGYSRAPMARAPTDSRIGDSCSSRRHAGVPASASAATWTSSRAPTPARNAPR